MPTYTMKVIRMKLGASQVRLALFKILTQEDDTPFLRTVAFFHDHEMIAEAAKLVEWRIQHELGALTFAQVAL
jgi:hypothetical protein